MLPCKPFFIASIILFSLLITIEEASAQTASPTPTLTPTPIPTSSPYSSPSATSTPTSTLSTTPSPTYSSLRTGVISRYSSSYTRTRSTTSSDVCSTTVLLAEIEFLFDKLEGEMSSIDGTIPTYAEACTSGNPVITGFWHIIDGLLLIGTDTSNPCQAQISNLEQRLGTLEFAWDKVAEANRLTQQLTSSSSREQIIANLNSVRGLLGLRRLDNNCDDVIGVPSCPSVAWAYSTGEELDNWDLVVDSARDVTVDTALTVGTLGGGLISNAGKKITVGVLAPLFAEQGTKTCVRRIAAAAVVACVEGAMADAPMLLDHHQQNLLTVEEVIRADIRACLEDAALGASIGTIAEVVSLIPIGDLLSTL